MDRDVGSNDEWRKNETRNKVRIRSRGRNRRKGREVGKELSERMDPEDARDENKAHSI